MLANTTLGGFQNARLGGTVLFDADVLGEPPPPLPLLNPSIPMPGPISYDLPGVFLPPIPTFPSSPVPTVTPIRNTTIAPSYPGAPTTLDRVSGIIANVVGAFATNKGFQPTGGAYADYARTQQTGIAANSAQQAAANAAVAYGSQGAGADTGANVGAAVGNIGDQIFGAVARHPFATLLAGAGVLLWILPSPRKR